MPSSSSSPIESHTPRPRPAPVRGRKARRRWLPWLGALVLVSAIVAGLRPRPIPVELGRVIRGPLRVTVNEEGRTRIRNRYTVFAPVAGQLRRITLKAGEPVRAGETVVAILDPVPSSLLDLRTLSLAEARRDAAAAQLAKAREAFRFARMDLERSKKLHAEGSVSARELENAQWREAAAAQESNAAESALRLAEAELAEFGVIYPPAREPGARLSLHDSHSPETAVAGTAQSNGTAAGPGDISQQPTSEERAVVGEPSEPSSQSRRPVEVLAPVSGKVLQVPEASTRVVAPGTALLQLGDSTDLEVVIEVLSREGASILPGALVELHHWGGDTPLEARVRLVEPSAFTKISALGVEEQRVNVIADLVTPPEQRPGLGDRFRVEARIVVWETRETLKVPSGALFRRGDDWAAFTLENGRTALQRVQVGHRSDTEVEILEGLRADQEIVLYPGDRIREGVRVRPVEIAP
ncbi:MAG: efflux RND transporter periplasmic adaptor subunit [Limisphaerales bacterium]